MDKETVSMLKQECPECKSKVGDIKSYMPVIVNGTIEIELECDNCGLYRKIIATPIRSEST